MFWTFILFFVLLFMVKSADKLPNFVVILTDDLGYNAPGYNNPDLLTPTLDKLANDGIILTSHYAYRYCSPTRAALLTGRSPYKLLNIRENLLPPPIPEGTDLRFTMLPARLEKAGYKSVQIGKWHQGFYTSEYLPINRGFNYSFGFLTGGENHFTQTIESCPWGSVTDYWENDHAIAPCNIPTSDRNICPQYNHAENKTEALSKCHAGKFQNCNFTSEKSGPQCYQCKAKRYTGFDFANKAVELIKSHDQKKPMFMYLALHNTHGPIQAPQEFIDMYSFTSLKRNTFDAMISVVDSTVKNVSGALKSVGMWDNTLLIWTSDNGSPCQVAGSNAPLRGNKGSDWEGGVRVPTFINGGLVPKNMRGRTLDGLVTIWDYYATFLTMAGLDPTDPNPEAPSGIDSINMWKYWSGLMTQSPRTEIVHDHLMFNETSTACFYAGHPQVMPCNGGGSLRSHNFKLMMGIHGYATWYGHFSPNSSWVKNDTYFTACSVEKPCLFDVQNDPGEHIDIAADKPDVVTKLISQFHKLNKEYHPPSTPPVQDKEGYCDAALKNGGFAQPWK